MEILEIQHMGKRFGAEYANKDINVRIEQGKIYGLLGKNGAGKTTLMKTMAGYIAQTEGRLIWNDKSNNDKINIGVAINPDKLDESLTAEEVLLMYGNSYKAISNNEIDELFALLELESVRKKKTGKFSTGMKQKLVIALAMVGKPDFLILDEPINGLDPSSVKKLRELLVKINREYGTTIMISSHLIGELTKIADAYIVLANGLVVRELLVDEIVDLSDSEKELYFIQLMENDIYD